MSIFLKIGEEGDAALVVDLPVIGRADAARRAVKEFDADSSTSITYFADRGAGQLHLAGATPEKLP
jgi:hypothetical protein